MMDPAHLGLFDTLVPIASILTISVSVGYTLPKEESFGIFLLLWWVLSVYLSLRNDIFLKVGEWSSHDGQGMLILIGIPAIALAKLYNWFQSSPRLRVFFYKDVPLWSLFALHIYRLDGLSIILPFWKGDIPKYLGMQMILLDVLIGASSLLLTWLVYSKGVDVIARGWLRDAVWFWNSIGLYDLCSAYAVLILNYFELGGSYVNNPPLSTLGFHPLPLIILFQAPLAIAIHILLLTSMKWIIMDQSKHALPQHIQRIRAQAH